MNPAQPKSYQQTSFFSQPGFRDCANLQVVPGSKEAIKTTVGSGRKLSESLAKSDPLGRFSKTLLESEMWASPEFFLNWKVTATRCGCSVYQLAPSAPRSGEIDTGSCVGIYSTPRVVQSDRSPEFVKGREPTPGEVLATWPTPRQGKTTAEEMETWQKRKDAGKVATPPLGAVVKATWPTPRARDQKDSGDGEWTMNRKDGKSRTDQLPHAVKATQTTTARGATSSGCLARTESFVERLTTLSAWLMGYTAQYLAHWETRSSRRSRKQSSGQS